MKTKKLTKKQEEKMQDKALDIVAAMMSEIESHIIKTTKTKNINQASSYSGYLAMRYIASGMKELMCKKHYKEFIRKEIL